MEPITITLSLTAIALAVSSCSDPETASKKNDTGGDVLADSYSEIDSGSDSVGLPNDTQGGTIVADTTVSDTITYDTTLDDTQTIVDTTNTPDTATLSNNCPSFPLKGIVKLFAESPCGATNNVSVTDLDETGYAVCSDFSKSNIVFQFDASGILKNISTPIIIDQIDYTASGALVLTGLDPATYSSGIVKLSSWQGTPQFIPFTPITIDGKTFTPTFPKGISDISGKIFVTAGNIDFSTGQAAYYPGAVLVYSNNSTKAEVIPTGGQNPTSMSIVSIMHQSMIAVVNTGNYNVLIDDPNNKGSVILIDPTLNKVTQTLALPRAGFGLSGEIAAVGALIALPSSDNSGQTALVDLKNPTAAVKLVPENAAPQGEAHFLTSVILSNDGKYLVTNDFNTGLVRTWDLSIAQPKPASKDIILDSNTSDNQNLGDSICYNGKIYTVVGRKIMEIQ